MDALADSKDEKAKAKAQNAQKKATESLEKAQAEAESRAKDYKKAKEEFTLREKAMESNAPLKPLVAPSTVADSKKTEKR